METKPLLYGLVGFFIGGLIVSLAAVAADNRTVSHMDDSGNEMTMSMMTDELKDKKGDAYDEAFISYMIMHHQAAIDMAKHSDVNAKHDEVKRLSDEIRLTQSKEIADMKDWQRQWNYRDLSGSGMVH